MVLRNFEGVITTYPEPENYISGKADDYFNSIYPMEGYKSPIGINGLLNESKSSLVPEGLNRLDRRENYVTNPEHKSLKDLREKRDALKEKKYQAQLKKMEKAESSDE